MSGERGEVCSESFDINVKTRNMSDDQRLRFVQHQHKPRTKSQHLTMLADKETGATAGQ